MIKSGLAPGENVVIDGVDRLRDGAKVTVRNDSGAAGQNLPAAGASEGQRRGHKRDGQGSGGASAPAGGAP